MSCKDSVKDFAYKKSVDFREEAAKYAMLRSEDAREAKELLNFIADRIEEMLVE